MPARMVVAVTDGRCREPTTQIRVIHLGSTPDTKRPLVGRRARVSSGVTGHVLASHPPPNRREDLLQRYRVRGWAVQSVPRTHIRGLRTSSLGSSRLTWPCPVERSLWAPQPAPTAATRQAIQIQRNRIRTRSASCPNHLTDRSHEATSQVAVPARQAEACSVLNPQAKRLGRQERSSQCRSPRTSDESQADADRHLDWHVRRGQPAVSPRWKGGRGIGACRRSVGLAATGCREIRAFVVSR